MKRGTLVLLPHAVAVAGALGALGSCGSRTGLGLVEELGGEDAGRDGSGAPDGASEASEVSSPPDATSDVPPVLDVMSGPDAHEVDAGGDGSITGLFPTGVNAVGVRLPTGSVDPHYTMTSTDPALPGPDAVVVGPASGWIGNQAHSKWISPQLNAEGAVQTYTYTTTFQLAASDPTGVSLTGRWTCDDSCVMSLNGVAVAMIGPPNEWASIHDFTVPAGSPFAIGINTLAIAVDNVGGGPTGLQVARIEGQLGP